MWLQTMVAEPQQRKQNEHYTRKKRSASHSHLVFFQKGIAVNIIAIEAILPKINSKKFKREVGGCNLSG
jgi:hypothetical protein